MNFELLTDEEIIKELASRYENIRLQKRLSEKDVSNKGGTNSDALYRFKKGSNISLGNFIKILRGVGELNSLEKLLKAQKLQSLRDTNKQKIPKRVFKSKKSKKDEFIWGEDR